MTRLLSSQTGTESLTKHGIYSSSHRSLTQLSRDANPELRLKILRVISEAPASLTNNKGEGGFITGGASEKLLVTECEILRDKKEPDQDKERLGPVHFEIDGQNSERKVVEETREREGLVIFSLSMHAKGGHTTSLAPKQRREQFSTAEPGSECKQSVIPYPIIHNHRSVSLPANVLDMHSQLVVGEEIWVWEPWIVVELGGKDGGDKKALLVSRFGLLI